MNIKDVERISVEAVGKSNVRKLVAAGMCIASVEDVQSWQTSAREAESLREELEDMRARYAGLLSTALRVDAQLDAMNVGMKGAVRFIMNELNPILVEAADELRLNTKARAANTLWQKRRVGSE